MLNRSFLFVSVILSFQVYAGDLGNYGQNYPIKERDAIDAMKEVVNKNLANGGQQKLVGDAQKRFYDQMSNITPPQGVSKASKSTVRLVDLSEKVNQDVLDDKKKIIVAAGTVLNPLKNRPLDKKVFFIDGREQAQLQFAKTQAGRNDKIILVAGNLWKSQEFLGRNVFLEMGLIQKMQIQVTPSIASQGENFKLKIEEIVL